MSNKKTKRPPHILFLFSDEHRYDLLGFQGNPIVRTPHLDRLAQDAVIFKNAYTPAPICSPARQAIAAGQLPKTCGCPEWKDLSPNYPTYARQFTEHAYTTIAAGKLHHAGPDTMQGWSRRVAGDTHYASGIKIKQDLAQRYAPPPPSGEGYWEGRAKWTDKKEIESSGVFPEGFELGDDEVVRSAQQVLRQHFTDNGYATHNPDKPLFMYVGLVQPHYPYFTSQELLDYYYDKVPLPQNNEPFDHPFLGVSAWHPGPLVCGEDVAEDDVRRTLAAYYGMIEDVDRKIGAILETIESVGQDLDDWVIVYSSDHGEMAGEHTVWEKQKFFEESAKVPLFIRYPKRFQKRIVEENVNLCDLYSTFCDLADLEYDSSTLDSRSLISLMEGDSKGWNNESISQFQRSESPWFPHNITSCMIKRDHLKYQYYNETLPEVLFDLEKDPGETQNFIDDPQYAEAVSRFRTRLSELGYGKDAVQDYQNAGYHA